MPSHFPQDCACSCCSNTYRIETAPIARIVCHCSICQAYTGDDYNDVTILLKADVSDLQLTHSKSRRWKLPPNVRRGLCTRCHKPTIETALGGQLVLVPTQNYMDPDVLAAPDMHIFYDSRVRDIEDDIPKYSGTVVSQAMIAKVAAQGLFDRLTHRNAPSS